MKIVGSIKYQSINQHALTLELSCCIDSISSPGCASPSGNG